MRAREWEVVRDALLLLGCEQYHENDMHFVVARAATHFQTIRKSMVPIEIQLDVIRALYLDQRDYESAIQWALGK